MFQRPKVTETEEDILRLQKNFLESKATPAAKVKRVQRTEKFQTERQKMTAFEDDSPSRDCVRLEAMDFETSALARKGKEATKPTSWKERKNKVDMEEDTEKLMDSQDTHITSLLSKIKERDSYTGTSNFKSRAFADGFPRAPLLNKDFVCKNLQTETKHGKLGKSLFARQFMSESAAAYGAASSTLEFKGKEKRIYKPMETMTWTKASEDSSEKSSVLFDKQEGGVLSVEERVEIDKENMNRIAEMTEKEVLEEQEKLKATLDPKLLRFLLNRKKTRNDNKHEADNNSIGSNKCDNAKDRNSKNTDETVENSFDPRQEFNISKDIVHMEVVEAEKIQWMKPLPVDSSKKIGGAARFDFDGRLLPEHFNATIDHGLYHHGEEPGLAGYTLEELFNLARANFQQQRIIALQTLGNIIEKDSKGEYVNYITSGIIEPLLDAGLPFLLRWAMDENTENLFKAAIFTTSRLLLIQSDQEDVEFLRSTCCGVALPSLSICGEGALDQVSAENEKQTLTDAEVVKKDVIQGLTNMQLLSRVRYIMEILTPTALTVTDCLLILIRFIQHSSRLAYEVFKCPRLLNAICHNYLTLSLSNPNERLPGSEKDLAQLKLTALRFVYHLMLSSRSIASKVWLAFDLQTEITKNLNHVVTTNTDSTILLIAVESLCIWRLTLLYNYAVQSAREMHEFIEEFIRKVLFGKKLANGYLQTRLQSTTIAFIGSLTRCFSYPDIKSEQSTSQKSSSGGISQLDCTMVMHFKTLITSFMKDLQIIQSTDTQMVLILLPALYNYLISFIGYFSQQTIAVSILHMIEEVFNECVLPWLQSALFPKLLGDLQNFTLLTSGEIIKTSTIASLPNFGANVLRDSNDDLQERKDAVNALASTFKLIWTMIEKHKGLVHLVKDLVTDTGILDYLKQLSVSESAQEISCRCVIARIEHHMVYYLIKIFGFLSEVLDYPAEVSSTYHLCGIKLLSFLQPMDKHLGFEMMSTYLFQPKPLKDCLSVLNRETQTKGINTQQESTDSRGRINVAIQDDLDRIKITYLRSSFSGQDKVLTEESDRHSERGHLVHSYSSSPFFGLCLPSDWMFKPIIDLYNQSYNTELTGKVISSLTKDSIESITCSLKLIVMLEKGRSQLFSQIPVATRLARLMCIFLVGNDSFLEAPIYQSLQMLLEIYSAPKFLSKMDFDASIPGLTSFTDFYSSLLAQYSATSYGDVIFSNFILFPLQRQHNPGFRHALWSEHEDILRIFSLPFSQMHIEFENFFDTSPTTEELIFLYSRAFLSENFRQEWTPLFYAIAVHHITNYIFHISKEDNDPDKVSVSKSRLRLLDTIVRMKDPMKKEDVLLYDKPNQKSARGFDLHKRLPPMRELLIVNRKA